MQMKRQPMTDMVLDIFQGISDVLDKHKRRNSATNIEDSFFAAAGHLVYLFADRRCDITERPIQRMIEDMAAVIEMNAMEMLNQNVQQMKRTSSG